MNTSKLFSLGTLALTTLALSSSVRAEHWNAMNDPNGFNADWHRVRYTHNFSAMPTEGGVAVEQTPWADSYWPKQLSAFAYRWKEFQDSGASPHLTAADRQRLFFNVKLYSKSELQNMSQEKIAKLSPLEKYSILIGDYNYRRVKEYLNKNSPNDAYWEGYCHAWAAASAHYTEPKPVTRVNSDGITIPFGSGDVKALLIANYADLKWGRFGFGEKVQLRYVGQLCQKKFMYPTTKVRNGVEVMTDYSETDGMLDSEFENYIRKYQADYARVTGNSSPSDLARTARMAAEDPACNDTNAGAFHIVMANQLGLMKEGFLMDKTRDAEIWNQPVYKYETKAVSTESPNSKSAPGTASVVVMETKLYYADDTDYGWTFWNPTLSGIFGLKDYFTSFLDEYKKYQDMLIKEGDLDAQEEYPEHVIAHADYKYKLELDRNNNIIGGQWITFDRPDDLYFMKKVGFTGDFEHLGRVYEPIKIER